MASRQGGPHEMSKSSFEFIYHHLFLPPNLPGAHDASAKTEAALLDFVHHSLESFLPGRRDEQAIKAGILLVHSLRRSRHAQGYLREAAVSETLQELLTGTQVVAFQITEQNAGVMVSRIYDSACFETFELSPTAEAIMCAPGRLVRYFPAAAVKVPLSEFQNERFRAAVAKTLTKMSQQNLREPKETKETKETTKEGKREQDQVHDPVDPTLVTELFTSMLRGCGTQVVAEGVRKNTRDDVVWKNSKLPWRRSSVWLLIRVTLQLSMNRLSGNHDNTYKEFMAFLMSQALQVACHQPRVASDVLHVMSTKISRRLCKLQDPSDGPWLVSIQETVSKSSKILDQRWRNIRERTNQPLDFEKLSNFDAEESTQLSLSDLDIFINSVLRRETATKSRGFRPVLQVETSNQDQLPSFPKTCSDADIPLHLMELESWVATYLSTWVDRQLKRSYNPVSDLKQLIETYHSKAASYYSDHPEGASRMILTIGELWHAADAATINEIPLLKNYSPLIPTLVWQALLLNVTVGEAGQY